VGILVRKRKLIKNKPTVSLKLKIILAYEGVVYFQISTFH
jgi:hypothetical protein